MSGLVERMMSWVAQQCQEAGPTAALACRVVGNPEEARVAGRMVDYYLTDETRLYAYGVGEGPHLESMVDIYVQTRMFQEGASYVRRVMSEPVSQRLIRTGFTPVASKECGATMSCEPDPECGHTMSCEPSADLNPSVHRLSMLRELLPARLEALRNDLPSRQRQSLDELLGTYDEIHAELRPDRERERELLERLRHASPELIDEMRRHLPPEGRLLLEELLSGRPH